ncbi:MAG: hypothetical protein Q9184_001716 [Pyrenodesmia sp. 2 TL-2023]
MYRRITNNEGWKGDPLDTVPHGYPLTHDILERLDALSIDGHHSPDRFEDDTEILQKRFSDEGVLHRAKRQATPDTDAEEEEEEGGPPKRHASWPKRSLTDAFLARTSGGTPPIRTPSSFGHASPATYDGTDALLDAAPLHISHQPWDLPSTMCGPALNFSDTSSRPGFVGHRHMQRQLNPCLLMDSLGDEGFGNPMFDDGYSMPQDPSTRPIYG